VIARLPGVAGRERPASLAVGNSRFAGDRRRSARHADRTQRERAIEELGKIENQWLARPGDWPRPWPTRRFERPQGRVADSKLPAERLGERLTGGVGPFTMDDECIAMARAQRTAHLPMLLELPLDAPGIEEHRVPGLIGVPEVAVEREKRRGD